MNIATLNLDTPSKNYLWEKLFSYGIAALFIIFLSPHGVANAYLILGHSHFMMTALYQYKTGRLTPIKVLIYALSFFLIFQVAHEFPKHFTLFVSAFLLVHVFSGEIRHFNQAYSRPFFMMTLAIMILLCSWLAIEMWEFSFSVLTLTIILNLWVVAAVYDYYRTSSSSLGNIFFYTLVAMYAYFVMLEYTGFRAVSFESFGFIVIAHYLTTYFNVTKSFAKKSRQKARKFIIESVFMNLLLLSGYILVFYFIGTNNYLYDYVYQPVSFYVWTLMHFLTTWNWSEYSKIFSKPSVLVKR